MRYTVSLLALFTLSGCNLILGEDCDAIALAGINLTLVDSTTQQLVDPSGAVIVAIDGSYADTVRFADNRTPSDAHAGLAVERPGAYYVKATVPGYRMWERTGVRVRQDGCHVDAVDLTAQMQQ